MVAVSNPKEQVIITPDVGKDYEITANKNKVSLTLKNKLKDSTTYSFNFRDAVQDITEKNPAVNLKLALSTGSYIDSLYVQGKVFDPIKNKDLKDITVALYQSDTFNILKHKAVYITKSNEKGDYIIENLKPGTYYIYAIDDKNRNLLIDSKTEIYGYLTDSINLKANAKAVTIPLVKLDARTLKFTNSRPYNTYFNIKTSKNLKSYKLSSPAEVILSSFGDDQANIKVYNTFDAKDSVAVRFQALDSINNTLDTTLYAKFNQREVKPEAFTIKSEGFKVIAHKGIIKGKIQFNKPLLDIRFDSIIYKIDSMKTVTFSRENISWDSLHNKLTLEKTFDKILLEKPKESQISVNQKQPPSKPSKDSNPAPKKIINNQLYIGDASFISIELDSSKRFEEQLRPQTLEESGILFIEIETTQPHYIIELLDKNFNIVSSQRDIRKTSFEDLTPGEYQIRLIIDKNNDGKWSPGNYLTKEEPEPIRFYTNEKRSSVINLKANWEVGPLLIKYP